MADTVTNVLTGVIIKGTGQGATMRTVAAGKTGTTNDSKDAWFAGFTCNITASVWMGYRAAGGDEVLQGPVGRRRHVPGRRSGGTS